MEHACDVPSLDATGTLIRAHLRPAAASTGWQLTWTNARHPPRRSTILTARPNDSTGTSGCCGPACPAAAAPAGSMSWPQAPYCCSTPTAWSGTAVKTWMPSSTPLPPGRRARDLPLSDLLRQLINEVTGPAYDVVLLTARIPLEYPA